MNIKEYEVVLTNSKVNYTYNVRAENKQEAIILAQAEAIKEGKGYRLVSCIESLKSRSERLNIKL